MQTTEEQKIYDIYKTQTKEKLSLIIKEYEKQLRVLEDDEKKISALEKLPKRTIAQEAHYKKLIDKLEIDKLNFLTLERNRKIVNRILDEKSMSYDQLKKSKTMYHNLININLVKYYDRDVISRIHQEMDQANSKNEAKLIYNHYKDFVKQSTQGVTFEEVEEEKEEDPREEDVIKLQRFVRGHQQKQKQKKIVLEQIQNKLIAIKNQKTFEKMDDDELIRNVEAYYKFINTLKNMRAQIQDLQNKDRTEEEEDILDDLEANIEENIGALYVYKEVAGISQKILMDRIAKNKEGITQGKVTHSVVPVITNETLTIENPTHQLRTLKEQTQIEKLKELIKKYPELKEGVMSVLLSELIKKGTIDKKDIDEIKRFVPEEKPYLEKSYTWLKAPEKQVIKTDLKYNVLPLPSVNKTYTYWD